MVLPLYKGYVRNVLTLSEVLSLVKSSYLLRIATFATEMDRRSWSACPLAADVDLEGVEFLLDSSPVSVFKYLNCLFSWGIKIYFLF